MSRDEPDRPPPENPEALRRAPRRLVRVRATISNSADGEMACRVDNLSRLGCRLHIQRRFPTGAYLSLRFPDRGALGSRVAWSDGLRSGLAFLHPLHAAVLDDLLRLFRRPGDPGDGPVHLRDWEG